jgi:hypothetical protein
MAAAVRTHPTSSARRKHAWRQTKSEGIVATDPCPASSKWQDLIGFEVGCFRVGQAEVDVQGPVPGQCLVEADRFVLDLVVLRVSHQIQGVGDFFEEQLLVFQRAEPAVA